MKSKLKIVRVILMIVVVVVLAAGTVFERYRGAEWVADHFYGSWWFAVLMGLVAVGSLMAVILKVGRQKSKFSILNSQFPVLLIHVSIPVILLGGALTSWTGERYSITLAPGETKEGITLERFEVLYYPGTRTPMDFVSHVTVPADSVGGSVPAGSAGGSGQSLRHETISMNHILRHAGRRYYQEDYDDEGRTTLSVSHDPYGIPVTYTGFALLLLGLGWLCLRHLHSARRFSRRVTPLLCLLFLPFSSIAAPTTLPRETASRMGEMYTLYKGRICPVQTFAKDFTTKLTGKATYDGLTSEQVLSGFMFYYDQWAPMLDDVSPKRKKESEALVQMLLSGRSLKLFPVPADPVSGSVPAGSAGGKSLHWYAQNDDLPETVSDEEYIFIRKHLSYCQELVVKGDYASLEQLFGKIRLFQEKRAAAVLPSPARVKAERLYNALTTGRWLPILTITLGLLFFVLALWLQGRRRTSPRWMHPLLAAYCLLLTAFLALIFILRWIAGGHIPMAGGFDTMNLMAIVIGILGLGPRTSPSAQKGARPSPSAQGMSTQGMRLPIALLAMGFCLLVAMMSGSNPPVTNLMPVLSSPLLCLHVAVIMLSYALFFFLALTSIAGLIGDKKTFNSQLSIFNLSKRLLYPAVFLLALGIVIGALWANISWGNYWTWDPKEVWALITLIVYAFPLHPSLKISREPRMFFLYCALAFISVIVTYFGVNFLLGGLHAYN